MHPDIEKLINIAKENGELTEKQKEIILRKAEKLGEDVDEVELVLESLPSVSQRTASKKQEKKKCPNCGALISDFVLRCPECGYVFTLESNVSKANRDYISELDKKLKMVKNDDMFKRAEIIKMFTVPNTKEALIQAFLACYSKYEATTYYLSEEKEAWRAKAKEFYLLLQSQPTIDSDTQSLLSRYSFIEKKHVNTMKVITISSFVFLMLLIATIIFIVR